MWGLRTCVLIEWFWSSFMDLLPQHRNTHPDWCSSTHRAVQADSYGFKFRLLSKKSWKLQEKQGWNVGVLSKHWFSCYCLNLKGSIWFCHQSYVLKRPPLIIHMKIQQEKVIKWDLGLWALLGERRTQSKELMDVENVLLLLFFPREMNWEGSPQKATGDTAPGWEEAQNCPESPSWPLCSLGFTPPSHFLKQSSQPFLGWNSVSLA